ncbi:butyrophilin-like protein 2 [Halichoeres trimaculatus]|uniref:butyrophilin-like protein 2 n=1 Tax=Halichoeres trimaculatus TaxID=147232 RepID=UPI003D9DFA81
MALLLLLLVFLCALVTDADGNRPAVIRVTEDSDVVLPCSLSSKENLESALFDWKKDLEKGKEERVFMYNAGLYSGRDFDDQDKQFKGRVSFFQEELKNGNSSIKITKTKVSDSGTYTCIFPNLQHSPKFSVQLVVGTCPKPSAKQTETTNDWSQLQCVVRGASPKPVVEWKDSSGNILPAEDPEITERGGRYDIILQTTVTKSDNYRCIVTQEEFCHQSHDDVLVHLPGAAPEPSVTILEETEKWSLLQCVVRGASPKPVVEWRDSSGNILPAREAQVTERGGSYDIVLQTTVTKTDHYSCVVTQEEINHRTEAKTHVFMSGTCPKPWAKPINETNDWSQLQCVVRGVSPKPVVEWKDSSGNILPAEDPEITERGGRYDIILQTTVTKSDNYRCVVTQEEFCHQSHDDIAVHISGAAPEPSVTILEHTEKWSLLQCVVRGASPKPVVEWRDSSGNILPAKEAQVTERGGSYDIVLQTTVTKTDHYSCVVTQEEINHRTEAKTHVFMSDPAAESSDPGPLVGWILFGVLLPVLAIVGFGFWRYRKVQQRNQHLQELNQELEKQNKAFQKQIQSPPPDSGVL